MEATGFSGMGAGNTSSFARNILCASSQLRMENEAVEWLWFTMFSKLHRKAIQFNVGMVSLYHHSKNGDFPGGVVQMALFYPLVI